jgi:hypothetical protein
MLTSVFRVTGTTSSLPRAFSYVVEGERIDWLDESAVMAALRIDKKDRHV